MKKITRNKILFFTLVAALSNSITFAWGRRDMPFMGVAEPSRVERTQSPERITYSHRAQESPYRHEVYHDQNTDEYGGYSHHVASGRIKTMEPVEAKNRYDQYHSMHMRQEQYK